jgi:hypothetical protein
MADDVAAVAPEELVRWLSPSEALARAQQIFGDGAQAIIWERLCGGIIKAIATTLSRATPPSAEPHLTSTPTEIPARYWAYFFSHQGNLNFWRSGDARFYFTAEQRHTASPTIIRCFGIKLDPSAIQQMLIGAPATTAPAPMSAAPPAKNKGGRPLYNFWDDLWIEVCAHIHEQGIPDRQVDIENAMLTWAAENGHDLSVSSVRPKARKLLQRLRNERTKT